VWRWTGRSPTARRARGTFTKLVEEGKEHPIEKVGAQVRPMMSWIDKG